MICVYTPDCTDFSGNGLGPVSPLSCTVTETLNGEWELTLTHPLDDAGKWRRLVEGCILRAPVPAAMTPGITMVTQATPEVKREVWKVRTNGSRLMLRSGTGTKYKIIGKYKFETTHEVAAKERHRKKPSKKDGEKRREEKLRGRKRVISENKAATAQKGKALRHGKGFRGR